MRSLILAVLLPVVAFGAEPPDVPIAVVGEPLILREPMVLKAGDTVPFDGVCLNDGQAIKQGKRVAACEATLAAVETKAVISVPLLIAGIAGAIAVGFAGGFAAAKLAK